MLRAVDSLRWGGAAWLVAGLAVTIAGLTGAGPHADRFSGELAVAGVIGIAHVVWWLHRRLDRVTIGSAVEASPKRRSVGVAMICAAPAILVLGAVAYPTHHTWLVGLLCTAAGVVQLGFAARAGRLERLHGAHLLRQGTGGFIIADSRGR